MDSGMNVASRLYQLADELDEVDEKYVECYTLVNGLVNGFSEKEAHDALTVYVCKGAQNHEDINLGLLTAILIEQTSGSRYYRDLTYISRDGLALVMRHLTQIVLEKYLRLQDRCRSQLIWLLQELISNSVVGVDDLCSSVLRQIAGGDISPRNVWLAESMLDVFIEYRLWVEKSPVLVATIVYTYLRLIDDHSWPDYSVLRQKEVNFCVSLLTENFADCMMIGKDLVRLLQIVARIPEIWELWKVMLHNPTSLSSAFSSIMQLLIIRTPRKFLQCRLTPDMEKKMVFLTSEVNFGQHRCYQDWFQKQYLSTPESQSLRSDLIRFICGVIHPSNEVLCSSIIPRWAVISWLLTTCTSNVSASMAKISLFYDWFLFDPERTNIMDIEPAILVMHHSIGPHPAIAATLLDFLCRIMPNFYEPLKIQVKQSICTALRIILEKQVLPTLNPLFDNQKFGEELRTMVRESFSEFFKPAEGKVDELLRDVEEIDDSSHNSEMNNKHDTKFIEEEEITPLVKHDVKEEKLQPAKESSNKIDNNVVAELREQLGENLKQHVVNLEDEKNGAARCEIMENLLEALLEEGFNQDITSSWGVCLAHILNDDFHGKIFPTEIDDESIKDSITAPLFVMYRTLCEMSKFDLGRKPLLNILTVMSMHQARLGYLLLYFIKASKVGDNGVSSYQDYVNTQDSWAPVTRRSGSKNLTSYLLSDLKLCQEDDVEMFCYLIPDIYTRFPSVAVGNSDLLHLVVSCIDTLQLQNLICLIMQRNAVMFEKNSLLSVLDASLEWESLEQIWLWQLITAHNMPIDDILPILPKLEFHAHAEALTNILLLFKQEEPTLELLEHIMSKDVKSSGQFTVSVLNYWIHEDQDELAELIAAQLLKSTTAQKRKRQKAGKAQGSSTEEILSHLDQLRSSCKQNSFFSLDALQTSMRQIQSSCSNALKAKYSDLFALAEGVKKAKVSKSRASNPSEKAISKKKKSMTIPMDSDIENDIIENEETLKPKLRKRKRT